MSALQWALLILSVAIVIAVVVFSRRDRSPLPRREAPSPPPADAAEVLFGSALDSPADRQLDIFDVPPEPIAEPPPPAVAAVPRRPVAQAVETAPPELAVPPQAPVAPPEASPLSTSQYDEFGVGRPRRRNTPETGWDGSPATRDEPPPAAPEPQPDPAPVAPAWLRTPVTKPAAAPTPAASAPVPRSTPPPKIISLLIVERSGGTIPGTKLHPALGAQGLAFGSKQIYHRLAKSEPVFSVASLVKPGVLLPADAATFATPGLSVFMVLPGPVKPLTALHDMLATTQSLARALSAEVYDSKKQPLSSESMRQLQAEVEAWARAASL